MYAANEPGPDPQATQPEPQHRHEPEAPQLLADVRLAHRPESAAAARRIVSFLTTYWGVPNLRDTAELLVSETVTNALVHVPPTTSSFIRLRVIRDDRLLRVEVHDSSRRLPHACQAGDTDESGRGWSLVEALADEHGSHPTPTGKSVWFALNAWPRPQQAGAAHGS